MFNRPYTHSLSALEKFPSHPSIPFLLFLTHYFSYFGHYLQFKGTVMGTMMAPSYVNIFMGSMEEIFLKTGFWLRFMGYVMDTWPQLPSPFVWVPQQSTITTLFNSYGSSTPPMSSSLMLTYKQTSSAYASQSAWNPPTTNTSNTWAPTPPTTNALHHFPKLSMVDTSAAIWPICFFL